MSPVLAALCSAPADRCALLDASGSLSFDELRRTVYALQKALLHTGASRAALMADNGRAWVAADLAMLASGIVSIPLPTYFSDAQIFHVLNDAGIDCVLTDDPARLLRIEQAFEPGIADASGLTLLRRALRAPAALPAGTAKITYTSGSTGAPKGVCLPQIAIDEVVGALHASTQSAGMSRHLALLPLPTLLENIASIYVPLLSGATMCMPASRHTGVGFGGIDSRQLTACIDRYRPESLVVVPEVLRSLMRQVLRGWRPARLRFIAVGGAHVCAEDVLQARDMGLPVYEGYGLSECASVVCLNTPAACRIGSVGRPLPHARVRIDAQGELHVRGAVMVGYLGSSPVRIAEVATGDVGEIDADGFVYIRGRRKDVLITSLGRNVSPEWVESQLLRHEAISQAMVVGESRPYLGALIVSAAPDDEIDRCIAATNLLLPDYARVRSWTRVQSFSAQLGFTTPNGRLRRAAIASSQASVIDALFSRAACIS